MNLTNYLENYWKKLLSALTLFISFLPFLSLYPFGLIFTSNSLSLSLPFGRGRAQDSSSSLSLSISWEKIILSLQWGYFLIELTGFTCSMDWDQICSVLFSNSRAPEEPNNEIRISQNHVTQSKSARSLWSWLFLYFPPIKIRVLQGEIICHVDQLDSVRLSMIQLSFRTNLCHKDFEVSIKQLSLSFVQDPLLSKFLEMKKFNLLYSPDRDLTQYGQLEFESILCHFDFTLIHFYEKLLKSLMFSIYSSSPSAQNSSSCKSPLNELKEIFRTDTTMSNVVSETSPAHQSSLLTLEGSLRIHSFIILIQYRKTPVPKIHSEDSDKNWSNESVFVAFEDVSVLLSQTSVATLCGNLVAPREISGDIEHQMLEYYRMRSRSDVNESQSSLPHILLPFQYEYSSKNTHPISEITSSGLVFVLPLEVVCSFTALFQSIENLLFPIIFGQNLRSSPGSQKENIASLFVNKIIVVVILPPDGGECHARHNWIIQMDNFVYASELRSIESSQESSWIENGKISQISVKLQFFDGLGRCTEDSIALIRHGGHWTRSCPLGVTHGVQWRKYISHLERTSNQSFDYWWDWSGLVFNESESNQEISEIFINDIELHFHPTHFIPITSFISTIDFNLEIFKNLFFSPPGSVRFFRKSRLALSRSNIHIKGLSLRLQSSFLPKSSSSKLMNASVEFILPSISILIRDIENFFRVFKLSLDHQLIRGLFNSGDVLELPFLSISQSASSNLILSYVFRPIEAFYPHQDHPMGFYYSSSALVGLINRFYVQLDPLILSFLDQFSSIILKQRYRTNNWLQFYFSGKRPLPQLSLSNQSLLPASFDLTHLSANSIQLDICYQKQDVGIFLLSTIHLNIFQIPNVQFQQHSGMIQDLSIFELTENNARFRNVLSNIRNEDFLPAIEFHLTKFRHYQPLLEVRSHHLQFVYLQRPVMTLISFFRDILPNSINHSNDFPPYCRYPHFELNDSDFLSPIRNFFSTPPSQHDDGIFRFSWVIKNSEVHLPINSCGNDAIVFIFQDLSLYRLSLCHEMSLSGDCGNAMYCQGPSLGHNIWISSLGNFQKLLFQKSEFIESWDLTQSIHYVKSPFSGECDFRETSDFQISMNLMDGIICSWCSDNAIAKSLNLSCVLTIQPIALAYPAMYSSVFSSLGFRTSMPMNCFVVELVSQEIDWVLSQGQYLAIVYMIQQNFPELTKVIPQPSIPIAAQIPITKSLHHRWCIDDIYPLFLSVTLDIEFGRIHLIENNEAYYSKYFHSHLKNSQVVPSEEIRNFSQRWFSDMSDPPNSNQILNPFGVPEWSNHHHYRTFHSIISHFSQHLSDDVDSPDPMLQSIGFVYISSLYFNVLRRHHGGGLSLEALAEKFIVTKGSTWTSIHPIDGYPVNSKFHRDQDPLDILYQFDEIPADLIILTQQQSGDTHRYSIIYSQNMVGNLRRCVVDILRGVFTLRITAVLKIVDFFVECITLSDTREKSFIFQLRQEKLNFRALLDVEVNLQNFLLCCPNHDNTNTEAPTKGLCFELENFQYNHCWRGFLECGPGWISFEVLFELSAIYISLLDEIYFQRSHHVESLSDSLSILVQSNVTVFPSSPNFQKNSGILNQKESFFPHLTPQNINFHTQFPARLEDNPLLMQQTLLVINPIKSTVVDSNYLQLKVSLPDLSFISNISSNIQKELEYRPNTVKLDQRYEPLFISFHDISHLSRYFDFLSHVPMQQNSILVTKSSESILNCANIKLLLHNATYGVNIMQIHCVAPKLSIMKTIEGLNLASSATVSLDIFNTKLNMFEPALESSKCTVICATDISSTCHQLSPPVDHRPMESIEPSRKLRIDLFFEPIEMNLAQTTLASLIKTFSLSDVVTSRSSNLPVYRIINHLGVDLECSFFLESPQLSSSNRPAFTIINNSIGINEILSLDTRNYDEATALNNFEDLKTIRGHCVRVKYSLNSLEYVARNVSPLDAEGLFEILMEPRRTMTDGDHFKEQMTIYSQSEDTFVTILMSVRVVDSAGTREVMFRSIFSISNDTSCSVSLIAHLNQISVEHHLFSQGEWYLPVSIISRFTNIWLVLQPDFGDHTLENSDSAILQYVILFSSLYSPFQTNDSLNSVGWDTLSGVKTIRLKSQLINLTSPMSPDTSNKLLMSWTNLFLPQPLETKEQIDSGFVTKRRFITKYPQISSSQDKNDAELLEIGTITTDTDRLLFTKNNFDLPTVFPCRFSISPPLKLANLFPQPILYRICEKGNPVNNAEGCLFPGNLIHLHCNPLKQLCLSIRLLNYKWSPWIFIPVYPLTSKVTEESMESLLLSYNSHDIHLPSLSFLVKSFHETLSVYCPLWIINRTGKSLCFREGSIVGADRDDSSNESCYIPSRGQLGIENCLVSKLTIPTPLHERGKSEDNIFHRLSQSSLRSSVQSYRCFVISPFDHCKSVSVSSSGNMKSLIQLVLRKCEATLLDKSTKVAGFAERDHLNVTDFQVFCYQGYTLNPPLASPENLNRHSDFLSIFGLNISVDFIGRPISPDVLISSLDHEKRGKLILLSNYEVSLIHQIQNLTPRTQKRTSISNLIGLKSSHQIAPFIHFDGDIPFQPKGIINLLPSLSFCVPSETDWSESISLQPSSSSMLFRDGGDSKVVRLSKNDSRIFEYSLCFHKGTGAHSEILAITVIPRIVLQSKLPFALQIRQVILDDPSKGDLREVSEEHMLLPYSIQQYHHPLDSINQLLQFRQYTPLLTSHTDDDQADVEVLSLIWSGEICVTTIGIYQLMLKKPDKVLNIQVDAVGVSLVVIFSLQNMSWPPYRIENKTSFHIKYQQFWKKMLNQASSEYLLAPYSSHPYAWDRPFNYCSEKLLLQIDFSQMGNRWISSEFPLNEVDYATSVKLYRLLPDLTHPIWSGDLEVKFDQYHDLSPLFCVISEEIVYLFRDSTMSNLVGTVNLCVNISSEEYQFAKVRLSVQKSFGISSIFPLNLAATTNENELLAQHYERINFWDINSLRRTILKIGSYFEIFTPGQLSQNPLDSLKAAILAGLRIDEIISSLTTYPLLISDILSALVILGEAENEISARYLLNEMYLKEYLRTYPSIGVNDDAQSLSKTMLSPLEFQPCDILYLHPPGLCPEFDQYKISKGDEMLTKYEVTIASKSYQFSGINVADILRWLFSIRICIEKTWLKSLSDKKVNNSQDSLETLISLRMFADGPTKVLEIVEDSLGNEPVAVEPSVRRMQDELTVSLYIPSIGLSIIESQPAELIYACFRDIQLIIERTHLHTFYIFTVEYIQIDNDLFNPLYPIAFHPRKSKFEAQQNKQKKILLLPGLEHSRRMTLNPTIHCFVQQKLTGKSERTVSQGNPDSEEDLSLFYFELISLWIAPIELSIDEELVVRTLRIFYQLKAQYLNQIQGKPLKYSEDPTLSQQYSTHLLLKSGGITPYLKYTKKSLKSQFQNVYIKLLEFHPIDLVLSIRSTPDFVLNDSDDLYLTKMLRVDFGNIRLNALIMKNVFGVLSFIRNILTKHYKASLVSQVYSLIGSTAVMEGSVGLLANLGTGVYDFFYEPIDGLLGDEQSFMEGLSKGGKSLASRAIGGTSAFTSKITGGIGLGMSMLTLDPKFQKNREKERLKAAQSVSEGISVGSYEFGRNIFEGVTGIVVEPYRGWVEEGGVGLGLGLARGLIGVALKPAVGFLDLASRTTEGIKHSAFNTYLEANTFSIASRIRLPRQFGHHGEILPYEPILPSLQLILDHLTIPNRDWRLIVLSYLPIIRRNNIPTPFRSEVDIRDLRWNTESPSGLEICGYEMLKEYILIICCDVVLLLKVDEINRKPSLRWKKLHLVWKCPIKSIEGFCSHSNGDLVFELKEIEKQKNVLFNDPLPSLSPSIYDVQLIDYYIFQEILEKLFGNSELAQLHPLIPTRDISTCIQLHRKRTGLKSFIKSITRHEYRLYKYVLYEFTSYYLEDEVKKLRVSSDSSVQFPEYSLGSELGEIIQTINGTELIYSDQSKIGKFLLQLFESQSSPNIDPIPSPSRLSVQDKICQSDEEEERSEVEFIPEIYDRDSELSEEETNPIIENQESERIQMILTAAIPLVDVRIHGPDVESTNYKGEKTYSITLKKKNQTTQTDTPLDFIKRDESNQYQSLQSNRLKWSSRESMKLIFPDLITAQNWKIYLSESSISSDLVSVRSTQFRSTRSMGKTLIFPCGGGELERIEMCKEEIAKLMSSVNSVHSVQNSGEDS